MNRSSLPLLLVLTNSTPYKMNCLFSRIIVFTFMVSIVSTANLLDFFYWSDEGYTQNHNDRSDANSASNCNCKGPTCFCCVDFNLTYIDLGGPGCVEMKYVSQEEGIAINVSYGNNLLHSDQVKGSNYSPSCMSMVTNLAQICARFSELQPYNNGLRGCLLLEPHLLNQITTSFDLGCFLMNDEEMKLDDTNNNTVTSEYETNNKTELEALSEEELIAAVNESAEQSLAFFGNLLGLTFGKSENNETDIRNTTTHV